MYKLNIDKLKKCCDLPYVMIFVLNDLEDIYKYDIHFHPTWESSNIKKEAMELLDEMNYMRHRCPCSKVVNTCFDIMKNSVYQIDAERWINVMQVLNRELEQRLLRGF